MHPRGAHERDLVHPLAPLGLRGTAHEAVMRRSAAHDRRRLDPGHSAEPLEQLGPQRSTARLGREHRLRQHDLDGIEPLAPEPRVGGLEPDQPARQQPRADEEDQPDRDRHHPERATQPCRELVLRPHQPRAPFAPVRTQPLRLHDPCRDRRALPLGHRIGHAGPQPREEHPAPHRLAPGGGMERRPDVARLEGRELRRDDTDDRAPPPIQLDRLADDVRTPPVRTLPVAVPEEDDIRVLAHLIAPEPSAEGRTEAEQVEESVRDTDPGDEFDAIRTAMPELTVGILLDHLDRASIPLPRLAHRRVRRDRHPRSRIGVPEPRQPITALEGERIEQERMDDAVDRRHRADPEPEREDRREREAEAADEGPERIAHVRREVVQPPHPARVSRRLPDLGEAAEREVRLAASFLRLHPPRDVRFGLLLEVEGEFFLELAVLTGAEEEGTKAFTEFGEQEHGSLNDRGPRPQVPTPPGLQTLLQIF